MPDNSVSVVLVTLAFLFASADPYPPVAPFGREPLPRMVVRVPMIFPVLGGAQWKDTYNASFGRHRHTGQDLRAPKMTPIVAPFSGTLGFKQHSFWIMGDDGWNCLGTHLNDDTPGTSDSANDIDYMFSPVLRHGCRVIAGQLIGWVGDSGDATGPHLHFELHGPKGIRNPAYSLKMAQRIRTPRPNFPKLPEPQAGEELWYVAPRDAKGERLYALVAARKKHGKALMCDTAPQFATIVMPDGADLAARDHLVAVYVKRTDTTIKAIRTEFLGHRE